MSDWHKTETFKSLGTISVEALKMLAITNGGSAIAVLSYLGAISSKSESSAHSPDLSSSLFWFCAGIVSVLFGFIMAYITQLRLFNEDTSAKPFHMVPLWLGILAAFGSAISFTLGCYSGVNTLALARKSVMTDLHPPAVTRLTETKMDKNEHYESLPEIPGLPTLADIAKWRDIITKNTEKIPHEWELVGVKQTDDGSVVAIVRHKTRR
ncbi:hypothetical protein [Roseicella frigidaeris]|uniref:hypothetical protein n=1 Tax=Roseicella frigidaeris TaxID=2230885 RepID=UPI000FDDA54E|nr:hypothetical protein [Roseicella frigidaeris]